MNLEPCFQSWDSNQAQFEGHREQCHNSKLALKEEQAGRWMLPQSKRSTLIGPAEKNRGFYLLLTANSPLIEERLLSLPEE